jgi:hypothetical protein
LHAHQKSSGAELAEPADDPAAVFPEARANLGPGDLAGGKQAEQQGRGACDDRDERQHRRIERKRHPKVGITFRHHPHQGAMQKERDADGGHRANRRKGQAFRHELADQTSATCTQREPYGDFRFTRGAAGKQKVREIRACDEQDHANCGQQRRQRLGELIAGRRRASSRGPDLQALIQDLAPPLACGRGAIERFQTGLKDGVGASLDLGRRHARLQSSEYVKPHRFLRRRVVQSIAAGEDHGLHAHWKPDIGLLPAGFTDEAARCDANDRERRLAHRQRPADSIGTAAEPALPVAVTDDRVWRRRAILVGGEYTADGRTNAQNLEESTRYQPATGFFPGTIVEAQLPVTEAALGCHHAREALGVIPYLLKFFVGQPVANAVHPAGPASRLVRIGEHHQLFGFLDIRQRGVEYSIP